MAADTEIRTRNRGIFAGEQFWSQLNEFETTPTVLNLRPAAPADDPFRLFNNPNINANRQKRRAEMEEMVKRREQLEEAEKQVELKKRIRAERLQREKEEHQKEAEEHQ